MKISDRPRYAPLALGLGGLDARLFLLRVTVMARFRSRDWPVVRRAMISALN